MKFNGATFNKAQQDQLKKKVGAELEAVVEKVNDLEAHATIKKYTVSDPTNITQLQALTQFLGDNNGRIIAIYGLGNYGQRSSLSYTINISGSTPYLELTSAPTIVTANEIQVRQITKASTVSDRWVSLIKQSGENSVNLVVNGKTGYSSIEVYYL